MSIEEKIKHVIAEQICCDERDVVPSAHLVNDLGADSLDLVSITIELENEFGVTVEDEEIENVTSVQDIINLVNSKSK